MKTREINPQQKIDRVVRTARTLFVTLGYHNVSIPQIVDASGVSIGAIYHHFGNKEGVAQIVHQQTLEQFQTRFDERLAPCSSTREKLQAFCTLVFEITDQEPETMEYMLLMKHGEFLPDATPICATEPFRQIQAIIAGGIADRELQAADSFLAAIAFTGVILRSVELRLVGVMKEKLAMVGDRLFAHAWSAIS